MLKRLLISISIPALCSGLIPVSNDWHKYQMEGKAQGTSYHITYYALDSAVTQQTIDSVFDVIDRSMSLYREGSLINRFNESSRGIPIDTHLNTVVKKSIEVYRESKGLFDITIHPLMSAWGFYTFRNNVPDSNTIASILPCVGTDKIRLTKDSLVKTKPCVTIDVNGIAQGYSVDVIAAFLESRHVYNYLVEAGGEIRVKGTRKPGNTLMTVGIEKPGDNEFETSAIEAVAAFADGALTTSGSYRKYFESNGRKYMHIIDPATGYPVQNEMISATVYARDAITADAWDNVLMSLGMEKALAFIDKHPDMAAFLIYKNKNGKIADTMSVSFKKLLQERSIK